MALDVNSLRASEFWKKKLHTSLVVRDVNKDGAISRADFDIIVDRYKQNGASPEHIKKIQTSFEKFYVIWGMSDESKSLTIKEFEDMFSDNLEVSFAHADEIYADMFHQIDMNGDDMISLQEWEVHYAAFGIEAKHAKPSFEAMDANSDGKVTVDEFVDYHREYFFSTEDKLKSSLLFGPLIQD